MEGKGHFIAIIYPLKEIHSHPSGLLEMTSKNAYMSMSFVYLHIEYSRSLSLLPFNQYLSCAGKNDHGGKGSVYCNPLTSVGPTGNEVKRALTCQIRLFT